MGRGGGGGRSKGKEGAGAGAGGSGGDGRAEWAVAARGALTLRLSEQAVLRQALEALGPQGPGGGGGAQAGSKRRRG